MTSPVNSKQNWKNSSKKTSGRSAGGKLNPDNPDVDFACRGFFMHFDHRSLFLERSRCLKSNFGKQGALW